MGYSGSYKIGNYSRTEYKHTTIIGLKFANVLSAIRGRYVTANDLEKILGNNFKDSYSTYELRKLLEAKSVFDNLFDYYDGEMKYIPKYEKKDYYDNGVGIIRFYKADSIPEKEELIEKDPSDVHARLFTNGISSEEFREIISHATYELEVFGKWPHMAEEGDLTYEEYINLILNIKSSGDYNAIVASMFFDGEIRKEMMNKEVTDRIYVSNKIKEFLLSLIDGGRENEKIFVVYDNGFVKFYDETRKNLLFNIETYLFFHLDYLFVDEALGNYGTVESVEEAEKLVETIPFTYPTREDYLKSFEYVDANDMIKREIERAKGENRIPALSFDGSY